MRDWKWYDRMAEIMSEGKEETSTFSDFSNNESRVKTPPQMTQGKNIGESNCFLRNFDIPTHAH